MGRVCEMIGSSWAGREPGTIESRVVADATALAELPAEGTPGREATLRRLVERGLKTASARDKVRGLLEQRPEEEQ